MKFAPAFTFITKLKDYICVVLIYSKFTRLIYVSMYPCFHKSMSYFLTVTKHMPFASVNALAKVKLTDFEFCILLIHDD